MPFNTEKQATPALAAAAAACQRTNLQRAATSCVFVCVCGILSWRIAKVTLLGIFKFEKTFISQSAAAAYCGQLGKVHPGGRRRVANQDVLVKTLALGKA